MNIKQKIKPYVLPTAIILGILLHDFCGRASFITPYIIFVILVFSFTSVDIFTLKPSWMDLILALFQIGVSLGGYLLVRCLTANEIIAEGILICVLCPVASSVAVVSCMLGANRIRVTTYTMIGNLMVACVAPIVFSFVGVQQTMPFLDSFLLILRRVASVLAIPFFIALALQIWTPRASKAVARFNGLSFYLWATALLLTLGQTIDFIFIHGDGNTANILWLGFLALFFCALQFGLGKLIGSHFNDTMAGGQLLGQKNTAMGIWMGNMYLNPLSSCILAFYSIFANLFNSWQLWYYCSRKKL
ncbi:MAG: transporter [bacterium]|nr:transporter [Candidatus Minthenecus merdequi]